MPADFTIPMFGASVSLSHRTALVGAPLDIEPGIGVQTGSATLYRLSAD